MVDEKKELRTSAQEPSKADRTIDAWFFETFHNLSTLPDHLFNRFNAAREELKKRLRAEE